MKRFFSKLQMSSPKILKVCLFSLFLLVGYGCEDDKLMEPNFEKEVPLILSEHSVLLQSELKSISETITTFINDEDVKKELLSYAALENDFEVYMPFSKVFGNQVNNQRGALSVFAKKFEENLTNCSSCRTSLNIDSLINDLGEHYALYAPYFAERFAKDNKPITVSWWDGIDTTGITPGIKTSIAKIGDIKKNISGKVIEVDDDYASKNPTVVIMPIEETIGDYTRKSSNEILEEDDGSGGTGGGGYNPNAPRDIDCRDIPEDALLELEMPQFRLHGNVARWPNANYLFMWTIVGDFTVADNGAINASANINNIWGQSGSGHRVSRHNASRENWLNTETSFIKSNWRRSETELRIAVAFQRAIDERMEISGTVKVDADGNFTGETTASYTLNKWNVIPIFNVAFDRCSTLAKITSDEGFGLRNGYRVYRFGKFGFYLKPD